MIEQFFTNHFSTLRNIGLVVIGLIYFCRGLYVGIFPALIDLVFLIFSGLVGLFWLGVSMLLSSWFFAWPPLLSGLFVGVFVMLGIYTLLSYYSRVFYEMIDDLVSEELIDPADFKFKLAFCLGGGLVELALGMLICWGLTTILVTMGNIVIGELVAANAPPNWLQISLVRAHNIVVGGAKDDVLAPLAKVIELSHDPEGLAKLRQDPKMAGILARPEMAALFDNAEAAAAVADQNLKGLKSLVVVQQISDNAALANQVAQKDFKDALDRVTATTSAGTKPAPETPSVAPTPAPDSEKSAQIWIAQKITPPIIKLVSAANDPKALARLKKNPEVQKLMTQPAVAAILSDPQVNFAVAKNDNAALEQNPLVLKAAGDLSLVGELSKPEVGEALDQALQK